MFGRDGHCRLSQQPAARGRGCGWVGELQYYYVRPWARRIGTSLATKLEVRPLRLYAHPPTYLPTSLHHMQSHAIMHRMHACPPVLRVCQMWSAPHHAARRGTARRGEVSPGA